MIRSFDQDFQAAERECDELAGDNPGERFYVLERFSPDTPLFDQDARGVLYLCDEVGYHELYTRHGNDVEVQYTSHHNGA